MEIEMYSNDVLKVIKLTKAFTSKKAQKPILQSVHVEANEGTVTFIATDSFKLIKHQLDETKVTIKKTGSCNIDLAQLGDLLKIFKYRIPVLVNIKTNENKLYIDFDGYSFSLFTVGGTFPNVEKAIISKNDCIAEHLVLSKENLLPIVQALKNDEKIDIYINKNQRGVCLLELSSSDDKSTTQMFVCPSRNW